MHINLKIVILLFEKQTSLKWKYNFEKLKIIFLLKFVNLIHF